jgi:hypothetical protein
LAAHSRGVHAHMIALLLVPYARFLVSRISQNGNPTY